MKGLLMNQCTFRWSVFCNADIHFFKDKKYDFKK